MQMSSNRTSIAIWSSLRRFTQAVRMYLNQICNFKRGSFLQNLGITVCGDYCIAIGSATTLAPHTLFSNKITADYSILAICCIHTLICLRCTCASGCSQTAEGSNPRIYYKGWVRLLSC